MSATVDTPRLFRKADWLQWYGSVIRRAQEDGIWDYCNPELLEASEIASSAAPPAAATAAVHRELIEPTRPLASEVNASATKLLDLNIEELERWVILKDDYNDRMREYEKKAKPIAELGDYIESTLDRSNHILIRDLYTPYDMLKALKLWLEPTPNQLRQFVRAGYESAQKWDYRVKPELWIKTYRRAYLDAKAYQPSLVDDYSPHYDFVNAIAQADPGCSNCLRSTIIQKQLAKEDPPDFITSCLEFFEFWQKRSPLATRTQ